MWEACGFLLPDISAFYVADYLNGLPLAAFEKTPRLTSVYKSERRLTRTIMCYTREHAVIYHILKLITATENGTHLFRA